MNPEVVIQPVDARINQANHILRAGRVGVALVFGLVKFAHEGGGVAPGQSAVPQSGRDGARAGGHAAAQEEGAIGFKPHHHHRARRPEIVPGNKRLINPPARQREAEGDAAENFRERGWQRRRDCGAAFSLDGLHSE